MLLIREHPWITDWDPSLRVVTRLEVSSERRRRRRAARRDRVFSVSSAGQLSAGWSPRFPVLFRWGLVAPCLPPYGGGGMGERVLVVPCQPLVAIGRS